VRRVVHNVTAAALVLASSYAIASASISLPAGGSPDLGSALMLRLFGETSDSNASFAASQGDRTSESPLRDLALGVKHEPGSALGAGVASALRQDRLTLDDLGRVAPRFSPSASFDAAGAFVSPPTLFTASYQPVAPEPSISPAPGTLAFGAPAAAPSGAVAPSPADTGLVHPATTQIGAVHFEGHDEGASQAAAPHLSLSDTSYDAGANFDVRAGKRSLNVNLSSEYEQLAHGDSEGFSSLPLSSAGSWQIPGGMPLAVPNNSDLNRFSLAAGVAVPVVRGLTLNLNYDAQRLYGGYGLPGLMNLDTINNSYGGKLTFNLPDRASSLSISAYQDRFQDSLLQINGSTQTREDVNFTVKF